MFNNPVVVSRRIVMALALLMGVSVAPQAFAAQSGPAEIPAGLTSGAQVSYTNEADLSTLVFTVFSFGDEAAAKAGLDQLAELATTSLESAAEPVGAGGTPEAAPKVTELTDVQGLNELGDEARAYDVPFGEGVSLVTLLVRDGANIHYWAYVITDLGSFDATASTPAATPAATPAGEAPIDVLVGIATPWFDSGINREGALIDQLPGQNDVPAGYTEVDRQESLDLGA